MNPYLSELINNYYELTGKPVASMTVTEYLQFASSATVIHPVPVPVPDSRAYKDDISREIQKKTDVISEEAQTTACIKPLPVERSEKKESERSKSTEANKENVALEILQSISG